MGRFRALLLGTSPLLVEEFRLPMGSVVAEAACHRALPSAGWAEQTSDRFEQNNYLPNTDQAATAQFLEWITRGLLHRYATTSVRAPVGPPRADEEIIGVWSARAIVRISLHERSSDVVAVTLSASGIPGLGDATLRSAIRDLRRSIEIQSGSLTPYQPPAR